MRTMSILPDGWCANYRRAPKVNEPSGLWDEVDAGRPNRRIRRANVKRTDRNIRLYTFGWGQWRFKVVIDGDLRRPDHSAVLLGQLSGGRSRVSPS